MCGTASARITILRVRIDHAIYGSSDLDAAARRVEKELGVTAVAGGHHDGLGTRNRIVPLSNGIYIELLAVDDPNEASRSPVGAALQAAIGAGDGLLGWAVAVCDLEAIAARLGTPVSTIGREGMTARLTGVAESLTEPYLPFFIERRADPETDPSPIGIGGITWIEVAGDAGRLEQWLGDAELPVRVVKGHPAVCAVGVGERELRTNSADM